MYKIVIILFAIFFTMCIFISLPTAIKSFLLLYEFLLDGIESFRMWRLDEWSDAKEIVEEIFKDRLHIGKDGK